MTDIDIDQGAEEPEPTEEDAPEGVPGPEDEPEGA
jgi:hypothetical protein